ncbi:hypothetical protein SUGI_0269880 [Cryptomeria japonica]|nr:hypothetical protein SUGI_0269880 [Cryptomeria japonica]
MVLKVHSHGASIAAITNDQPIPCSIFNTGYLYAYAVSYDWGKSAQKHNVGTAKHHILLRVPPESEIRGKH